MRLARSAAATSLTKSAHSSAAKWSDALIGVSEILSSDGQPAGFIRYLIRDRSAAKNIGAPEKITR
jgi:hypothetical protein